MGWRQDSSAGAFIWDTEPLSEPDLLSRDEELAWLMSHGRRHWQLINGRIARTGDPVALEGTYGGLQAYPPTAAQATASLTTGTATPGLGIWTVSYFSPLLANAVLAPSAYKLSASGTAAVAATGATTALEPSIASCTVNAAPTTPQTLGNSGVMTLATSALTALWRLEGELTIRSVGTAGTAWFMGTYWCGIAAAPTTPANYSNMLLGGTVATVDFTGATASMPGGLCISQWNPGSSTISVITNSVHFASWN